MNKQKITIAHSPDSDDAFMFYALANDKITSEEFEFDHLLKDIETLNQAALKQTYPVSAVSMHLFPQICEEYALLSTGASMGDGYGPMLVTDDDINKDINLDKLEDYVIAVPGLHTTALLALKLYNPKVSYVVKPFDQIIPAVKAGEVDVGLIIHEGQLTYAEEGMKLLLDMGVWWKKKHDLPLPLGGNVILKSLGQNKMKKIAGMIKEGIQYSLDHREEAIQYALKFARGMDPKTADEFVGMYVNDLTVDYGKRGQRAVELLFEEAYSKGLIDKKPNVEFLTP